MRMNMISAPLASAVPVSTSMPPKVVLVGDSVCLGYAALVVDRLTGQAVVLPPPANGGDSRNVLEHLVAWVVQEQPELVHFNCGLHDLKRSRDGRQYQVPLDAYTANLTEIVRRLLDRGLFDGTSTSTPRTAAEEHVEAFLKQASEISKSARLVPYRRGDLYTDRGTPRRR